MKSIEAETEKNVFFFFFPPSPSLLRKKKSQLRQEREGERERERGERERERKERERERQDIFGFWPPMRALVCGLSGGGEMGLVTDAFLLPSALPPGQKSQ